MGQIHCNIKLSCSKLKKLTEIGFSTLQSQGGGNHVVSVLRSCNAISAAVSRAERREEGSGNEGAGREGETFHDKNYPLTVR